MTMQNHPIIGIDLGGTNVRCGVVSNGRLIKIVSKRIHSNGTLKEVLQEVFELTDQLFDTTIKGIGIGVPGLIDEEKQLVYDVVNIPSWKEIPLQKLLEDRYRTGARVNNDANCFALGEYHFGKGKGHDSMIGLTIGTGLGSGLIIHQKLYNGANFGAGEFGMIDYLDQCYEYYASGSFFQNIYKVNGEAIFKLAHQGDPDSLKMYSEMGHHLGNAIKMILYAFDPSLVVLGGSVSKAWSFFNKAMWQSIKTFAYKKSLDRLRIEVSELENSGILGAAALWYAED